MTSARNSKMKLEWEIECRYTDMVTDRTVIYPFSFILFAEGGNDGTTGRPLLLARIWPAVRVLFENVNPNTARQARHFLRRFWLFLDDMDALRVAAGSNASPIDDLNWTELELIWRHWIDWLRASKWSQKEVGKTFWFVKKVLDMAFESDYKHGRTNKEALELFGYFKTMPEVKVSETLQFE